MTQGSLATVISRSSIEAGQFATECADARDLALTLGDSDKAAEYKGMILGVASVLEIIDKNLDKYHD